MDLEGQRVMSRGAGCTKSGIWEEDRIKRFVRSPGSRAVEKAKKERHEGGEQDREIDDQAEQRDRAARKEKPILIVGRTSLLSRGYTMNTRGDGKTFRDPDGEGERSVDGVEQEERKERKGGSA